MRRFRCEDLRFGITTLQETLTRLIQMKMIPHGLLVCLISGMFLLSSCGSIPRPLPEAVVPTRPSETRPAIYLDISQSMKGFAMTGSQYEKSLWELRTFLENRETPIYLVGNDVRQDATGPALIADAGRNKELYSADQDNLAAGIAHFNLTSRSSGVPTPTSSPAAGNSTNPAVYILITDAVQSLFTQSPNEGCSVGSDWICVKQEMQALVNQGWAGCVIAIRSQFDGLIFPERDGQRGRFWYRSDMEDMSTFRPFYLFMFSPSAAGLASFSSKLQEAFRQHLMHQSFEVLELTSLSPVSPVDVKDERYERNGRLAISKEQINNDPKLQDYSRIEIRKRVTGIQPDSFTLNLDAKAPAEADVTWRLVQLYNSNRATDRKATERDASLRYPDLKLIANHKLVEEVTVKGKEGTFSVEFQVDWPVDSGTPAWSVYRLDGFVMREDPMVWINNWSTEDDTTITHATRTLFLNRLLGDLWKDSPLKLHRRIAELYVWVGPKES